MSKPENAVGVQPTRTLDLVSWETSNAILAYTLDRYAAADGPITSAATDYARAACPAN